MVGGKGKIELRQISHPEVSGFMVDQGAMRVQEARIMQLDDHSTLVLAEGSDYISIIPSHYLHHVYIERNERRAKDPHDPFAYSLAALGTLVIYTRPFAYSHPALVQQRGGDRGEDQFGLQTEYRLREDEKY